MSAPASTVRTAPQHTKKRRKGKMSEELNERVRARPYGKCYLDKNDMKVIAEVNALLSRLAETETSLKIANEGLNATNKISDELQKRLAEAEKILDGNPNQLEDQNWRQYKTIQNNYKKIDELESRLRAASEYFEDYCVRCENFPNKECKGCSFFHIKKLLGLEAALGVEVEAVK
jgi:predicted ribosome quality control (RQC) complex YloA/Tae2 family protein